MPFLPQHWANNFFRVGTTACLAAALTVVTTRDMYEKHQWDEVLPGSFTSLRTGDVVLVSNRWFTLESWPHKWYSFVCKWLMKTAWDDVGVIVADPAVTRRVLQRLEEHERTTALALAGGDAQRAEELIASNPASHRKKNQKAIAAASAAFVEQEPYILIANYDHIVYEPFREFCERREPRGVAVRTIVGANPNSPPPLDVSKLAGFVEEAVTARRVTPYSVMRAAWQRAAERAHYRWAVESSELAFEIRQRQFDGNASAQAIEQMKSQLHDRIAMGNHYAKALGEDHERPYAKLFNASLVAEALQTIGVLLEPYPFAFHYTPVDFAWCVPMINLNLASPKMVFTS